MKKCFVLLILMSSYLPLILPAMTKEPIERARAAEDIQNIESVLVNNDSYGSEQCFKLCAVKADVDYSRRRIKYNGQQLYVEPEYYEKVSRSLRFFHIAESLKEDLATPKDLTDFSDFDYLPLRRCRYEYNERKYSITEFSRSGYSLTNTKNNRTLYFDINNNLYLVQYQSREYGYTVYIRYRYPEGTYDSMVVMMFDNVELLYDRFYNLEGYWIGRNGYDLTGKIIKTRQAVGVNTKKHSRLSKIGRLFRHLIGGNN